MAMPSCREKAILFGGEQTVPHALWERTGSGFPGERTALVPKQWLCHCPGRGQPSVNPQKLDREWTEEQEMVLLGEDPSQNGDSRSLTLAGIGP